jgi:hypothetical protein
MKILFKIARITLYIISFYEIEIIEIMLGYSVLVFMISILLSLLLNIRKGLRVMLINALSILGLIIISFIAVSFTGFILEQQILASLVAVEIATLLLKL